MKGLVFALILAFAAPAGAQSTFGAWPEPQRPIADTASNIVVAAQIGIDTIHGWRSSDRSTAFACQAIRLGVTIGAAELLKRIVHKERPDGSDFKSFPSMHTGVAMASAGWNFRIGIPIAAGVGALRMGANKHDWKDVLAGGAIGYFAHTLGPCDQ